MPELILLAAIALLLMGVGRLAGPEPRSTEDVRSGSARDYLDRLLGPAQDPADDHEPPQTTTPPPTKP